MSFGKLYGVGVGTGAPDLMTLMAVKCLKSVDCIAIPRKDEKSRSVAWEIAQPNVTESTTQERLFLNFPMTKDPKILLPAWDIAFKEIYRRLEQGKDVAFITEGDPFVYSIYIYLSEHAKQYWPDIETEVIPGITSLCAVPIAAGVPLADGQQRIAVFSASYGLGDLKSVLKLFDTILLMKIAKRLPEIISILKEEGLLDHSTYVSRATMKNEQVIKDLESIKNLKRHDYFSMIMVSKNEKKGILKRTQTEKTCTAKV